MSNRDETSEERMTRMIVQSHLEAAAEMRPHCIYGHPQFPGARFILYEDNWPPDGTMELCGGVWTIRGITRQ